jgi:hypothetical protein
MAKAEFRAELGQHIENHSLCSEQLQFNYPDGREIIAPKSPSGGPDLTAPPGKLNPFYPQE